MPLAVSVAAAGAAAAGFCPPHAASSRTVRASRVGSIDLMAVSLALLRVEDNPG